MRPYRSLNTPANVDDVIARLARVQPDSVRKWGTMTPHEMLCHLADSFSAMLGERPASSLESIFSRTVVKWVALHTSLPWPQGVPTRPEVDPKREGRSRWSSSAIARAFWNSFDGSLPRMRAAAPIPTSAP